MPITIDTSKWAEATQTAFAEAFWDVSGINRETDSRTPCPWAAPWLHAVTEITVDGTDVRDWAQDYWRQCRDDYEEATAIIVFQSVRGNQFDASRMSQKDWCRKCGLVHFDQRAFSGTACDGTIFFTRDEDAVRFLRNNADRYVGDSNSDYFCAEEIIRTLA